MKKITTSFSFLFLIACSLFGQEETRLGDAQIIAKSNLTNLPGFIKLKNGVSDQHFASWANYAFNIPAQSVFKPYETFTDALGYTHTRHKQYMNGYPVEGTMLISHARNGKVELVNGDYYREFSAVNTASITEEQALAYAIKKVNAQRYMWQNTTFQKQTGNNYTPHGELVIVHKKDADYSAINMRLAFKFNIYAEVPLYRANIFVDANTGEILDEQNLICTIDVTGTAVTKYSGTMAMVSDSTGPGAYRLQETGRGNGIETYNLQNGTTYQNVDFTNTSSTWTSTGADQVATDAHWGAEMTYDYYMTVHNRNSIDGNGFALKSYVHYSNNFVNAFWNGQEMTYGDGNGTSYFPLTSLDVCGHEITHGLVNFTANLGGGEAGALNEAFSDIFGTTIEFFARPLQNDWLMGADFMSNGAGFRDMSNPKSLGQPDTYQGVNWDPNGQVHNNNGPCTYWYYLLCQGGTGTNDNGNVYNVSGITMARAQMIAFRGLTVYFTPGTNYSMARMYTIQASTDLYGLCSPEFQSTTNAWYAVGVGAAFSASSSTPVFSNSGITCAVPITVSFTNSSQNAASFYWQFGDGDTSTQASPSHTYTLAGTYTVNMVATSCGGNKDSIQKVLNIGSTPVGTFFSEGFESTTLPGPDWSLASSGANWTITSMAAATGVKSAYIDRTTNIPGNTSTLESVSYDISVMTSPKLTFKMAYRQNQSTDVDKLQVQSSTDCGATWTPRWTRSGSILATVTPPDSFPFFPGSANFTTYTVNINALLGKNNVRFRFNFTSDTGTYGNNFFIDDINLFDAAIGVQSFASVSGFEIFPNPTEGSVNVNLQLDKETKVGLKLTDVLGREVQNVPSKPFAAGSYELSLGDKATLKPGIYFVNLETAEGVLTRKIIVK